MTITARFPGICRKCGKAFAAGAQINWVKGSGSEHVECPATVAGKPAAAPSAKPRTPKPTPAKPVATVVEIGNKLGQFDDRLACRVATEEGETFWAHFNGKDFEMYSCTVQATPEQVQEATETRERLIAEHKAALAAIEADIVEGRLPITLHYTEGEYLSAHTVRMAGADAQTVASRLLESVGATSYINGWGNRVQYDIVQALGTEFTYPALLQHLKPARDAAAKRKADAEAARQAKFDEAARTGKPVLLRSWSEGCNSRDKSCDIDNLTEWALPTGKTRVERVHTY